MSEATPRAWYFYVDDMILFSEKAISYTEGLSQSEFISDDLTYDATLRNLELIGEAATRIPSDIKEKYSDIPWRLIIATRNRLIHAYLGIDNDTIWSIIHSDLPDLLEKLEKLKESIRTQ